jgi:hypothetical protein
MKQVIFLLLIRLQKEIIVREDLRKYEDQTTSRMPYQEKAPLGSFKTKVPVILSSETPRPYKTRSVDPPRNDTNSNRISHTEFETLYDVDETKFSTFKSQYTTKDTLRSAIEPIDLPNEYVKRQQNVLLKAIDDQPRGMSTSRSLSSHDNTLYSYEGLINSAFADVIHADMRKISPVELEEAKQLTRIVRRYEPPEDEAYVSKTYSISPEQSIRIPQPPDRQRLSAKQIDFNGPDEHASAHAQMMLSYGHQNQSGIKWDRVKELHTVDWDAMKNDSLVERGYPHANLIQPIIKDEAGTRDVRNIFRNDNLQRQDMYGSMMDAVLPDSLHASFMDASTSEAKVGDEVLYPNPFVNKARFSTNTSFKKKHPDGQNPIPYPPVPANLDATIETYKYEVHKSPRGQQQDIRSQSEKRTIIEKLISDLDTDEKLSNVSRIEVNHDHRQAASYVNKINVFDDEANNLESNTSDLGLPMPPQFDDKSFGSQIDFEQAHNISFRENPLFNTEDEDGANAQILPPPPPQPPFAPSIQDPNKNAKPNSKSQKANESTNAFGSILNEIKDFKANKLKPLQTKNNNHTDEQQTRLTSISPPINFKNDKILDLSLDQVSNSSANNKDESKRSSKNSNESSYKQDEGSLW